MGYTLCVIGCGTMGIAIISGVIASLQSRDAPYPVPKWESHTPGTSTPTADTPDPSLPSLFIATVTRPDSAKKLQETFRGLGGLGLSVQIVIGQNADVVILWKHSLGKLLISILAGVTIAQLRDLVPLTTKVVRAMPNTPCRVGSEKPIREGMTVVSNLPPSDTEDAEVDRSIILKIFSSIGRCRFLDEKHFDACTALSGSGPAFACIFLEAMADGGVMMGLPRAEALELAAQTLQGAARMALQAGAHPAQIKDSVTTPGGCTIAGLLAMEDGKVRSTIARAIQIATERASELGQPNRK
ncbi:putative delta 1-pyrroline-5-carboxylate reductase [Pisolithus orientalis]|uniref:putative delta 1-pyrroline-5-carboxylate reductase n=1 Tax=Pisolithus orientalis TaxID=936130 RepID=UPI002223F084|nr:putative delta 1-pyrroline-5-carboxylate reductase [Pisolithus orientalis]KAI6028615.1 putative delta 1-pyrroline-5-carboxylate reductase [Pisolithus orientalis]